eukprot:gnl/MRDRNA2_/MRDRNA2_35751_c0_seq2.p1 gnl/MRDRNA2_/MRDRNA2_35751_c0~~gnl/MRDRNA2_/MRDRNA2_35751_c0_seq2.p1  ORF type:complete len:224 (+),score=35.59 gnl/MRDRNA2_/MRDRNA2_35751_c0_seq2:209-880(+)
MFGDGELTSCKPISERDLAAYLINCVEDKSLENKILPIGGPGKALTPKEQGALLFKALGKEPKMSTVPVGLFDVIVSVISTLASIFPGLTDSAEFARIGRYYAVESMLLYDPEKEKYLPGELTPSYGTDTLEAFYKDAVQKGLKGQELGDQAVFDKLGGFFKKKDEASSPKAELITQTPTNIAIAFSALLVGLCVVTAVIFATLRRHRIKMKEGREPFLVACS